MAGSATEAAAPPAIERYAFSPGLLNSKPSQLSAPGHIGHLPSTYSHHEIPEDLGHVVLHNALLKNGAETIFGVPGRSVVSDPFRFVYESQDIHTVVPLSEQGAGHMAEGFARATGKPGVVMSTSPYGVTSLVTPMQDALSDGTPMVVFSSLCSSISHSDDEFQASDTLGITMSCTKWSSRITKTEDLESSIDAAFAIAAGGRPGPVLLEVPAHILNGLLPSFPQERQPNRFPIYSKSSFTGTPQDIDKCLSRVARLVNMAEKPILYVGQGMLALPEGPAILKEFAHKAQIPVTTSLQGLGAFDEHDPLSLHMVGQHGTGYANNAIQEADLVIALGARFDDRVTGSVPKFAPKAIKAASEGRGGIVHFDIVSKNVDKVVQTVEVVYGDCATNLARLTPQIKQVAQRAEWSSQITSWKKRFPLSAYKNHKPSGAIKTQEAIEKLSDLTAHMKDKVLITTGVGQHQMWAAQHYRWQHPRSMITSGGLGTMGYGIPAAIGAKIARPDCLVIDIDGDASFNMTMVELMTAARDKIPIKVLLCNNEEMGMVSDLQRLYYDARFNQNRHTTSPNYVLLSQSFGVAADRVTDPAELEQKLKWLIDHDGPAVLEVVSEKDGSVYPVVPAGKGLDEFITYPEVVEEE